VERVAKFVTGLLVLIVLISVLALARVLWGIDLGPFNDILDTIAERVPSTR